MTKIYTAEDPKGLEAATQALANGQLVVVPTDTVYGVASRLTDDAILRLYLAKERPPDKAVPILLASPEEVEKVAQPLSAYAKRLAEKFWPGPLTLVLLKKDDLPERVSGLPTIGVRIPDNKTVQAIIRAAGGALAITSANRSGQQAARTVQEALDQLGDAIAVAIDGGPCSRDVASTVASLEGRIIRIIREGPISEAELEAALEDA